jgi:uncharacterized protein (TIGR02246 family)
MSKAPHDIDSLLERLTAAWREGRTADLAALFHERVISVPPGFQLRVQGRDAVVQTYEQFVQSAEVVSYDERDVVYDTWGNTAVATYRYEMSWIMDGHRSTEAGHDVLVLARQPDGGWQIVWRTLVPLPQ